MAKANAAQGATTSLVLTSKAIAALSSYFEKKSASGKDVWEQSVPSGQYNIVPFAQPAVVGGTYPKPADTDAKALAKELGCDVDGDIAHVHCQLVDASGKVVAKATMRELAQEMALTKATIKQLFTQPYTMQCEKGDIQKRVSRKWTIS
jgi:hypothetical protein